MTSLAFIAGFSITGVIVYYGGYLLIRNLIRKLRGKEAIGASKFGVLGTFLLMIVLGFITAGFNGVEYSTQPQKINNSLVSYQPPPGFQEVEGQFDGKSFSNYSHGVTVITTPVDYNKSTFLERNLMTGMISASEGEIIEYSNETTNQLDGVKVKSIMYEKRIEDKTANYISYGYHNGEKVAIIDFYSTENYPVSFASSEIQKVDFK